MNTAYSLDAYRSHELSIAMRTSSGDTITFDFANRQSASFTKRENDVASKSSLSFSSMQSFSFSIDSNGISEQDKKEIDNFMKIAQPYIESFLSELQESAPKSPVTKVAKEIASLFEPSKERNTDQKNLVKTNIVKMFDKSMEQLQLPQASSATQKMLDELFKQTQTLLEKTLLEFENIDKSLYA